LLRVGSAGVGGPSTVFAFGATLVTPNGFKNGLKKKLSSPNGFPGTKRPGLASVSLNSPVVAVLPVSAVFGPLGNSIPGEMADPVVGRKNGLGTNGLTNGFTKPGFGFVTTG